MIDNDSQQQVWSVPPVIVCHCNALRERHVRDAARAGAATPAAAFARHGCKPKCGQCLPYAREVIRSAA